MGFDASTQITINGVPCWDEGTEEHFGRSATSAVYMLRSLRCPWSNRANLVKALQTGSQQIGSVTLITSGQLYPGPYANMYVDAIDITGEGVPFEIVLSVTDSFFSRPKTKFKPAQPFIGD